MKAKLILSALFTFVFYLLSSQSPQGFNYQAVAQLANGDPLSNMSLPVRITIQSEATGGTKFWVEEHLLVTTNKYGLFIVTIGAGTRLPASTVKSFSDIDWKVTPKFIQTEVNYNGWKTMGSSQIWSVPYSTFSTVSGDLAGPVKRLAVIGSSATSDTALFEVKNIKGQTVLAVYNEGVRIFVGDSVTKGATKGGFAIGGFGGTKTNGQEYFRVTRDSTIVNVRTPAKGKKGGFAIGGFGGTKAEPVYFLNMTPSNYFIGENSGSKIANGLYNSFMGYEAGRDNTDGSSNVFLGYKSGLSNTVGENNLFIGKSSGNVNTSGSNNILLGSYSGNSNNGSSNIFIGSYTGYSNAGAGFNIFLGNEAGFMNKDGNLNIFIGARAGRSSNAMRNLFIGVYAGESSSTGEDNMFVGNQAGQFSSTGTENTFLGSMSGWKNDTGNRNTYLGYNTGASIVSGQDNVMIGHGAGQGLTAGMRNTFVGFEAGGTGTGDGNVFIGYQAGGSETGSNKLYIENSGQTSDNALIYGDFNTDVIKLNGTVNVRDVLSLSPRSTAPPLPSQGDMYFDSAKKKLMVWDGDVWQACW
jgi:hypothetical protein